MARVECSTSINGIYCVCDYNAYPVGNYPNIVMRIDYSFRVRMVYAQNSISGYTRFWFHTNSHTVNIPYTAGAVTTGVLASGSVDISWGSGASVTHVPGYGIDLPGATGPGSGGSGSSTVSITSSIPAPTKYDCSNPRNITPTSATIDYFLTNKNNYWRVYLWDKLSGKTWNVSPDTGNGTANLTGLNPETNYQITTKVVDRSGNVKYTGGVFATFTTLTDQLKLYSNDSETLKIARVFYNKGGIIKKVKKGFINQNGTIKRFKNAGSTAQISLESAMPMSISMEQEESQYEVIKEISYIEILDDRNEYEYEYGLTYKYKDILYFCEDFTADDPTQSYGKKFTSRFTPNYLVDRKFRVVVE